MARHTNKDTYRAHLTTQAANGPRSPITAGAGCVGQPVQLSYMSGRGMKDGGVPGWPLRQMLGSIEMAR